MQFSFSHVGAQACAQSHTEGTICAAHFPTVLQEQGDIQTGWEGVKGQPSQGPGPAQDMGPWESHEA